MSNNVAYSWNNEPAAVYYYSMVVKRAARCYQQLSLEAKTILRLCDGVRTLDNIFADSPLATPVTVRIMKQLLLLGAIATTSKAPSCACLPTTVTNWLQNKHEAPELPLHIEEVSFSSEEEAFFARPIVVEEIWTEEDSKALSA